MKETEQQNNPQLLNVLPPQLMWHLDRAFSFKVEMGTAAVKNVTAF